MTKIWKSVIKQLDNKIEKQKLLVKCLGTPTVKVF